MDAYGDFATPTYVNAYKSNFKAPTKNCTLPRNSSKCEESNGVIFTWIGEEISLLILFEGPLFRVAAAMNLATAILMSLAIFIALFPHFIGAVGGATAGDHAEESAYFTYLLTK